MKARTSPKMLAFFLCVLLLLSALPLSASAEETQTPSASEATAVSLYHVERMRSVFSKDEDKSVGAGSTVKIMAGLLLCEALEKRQNESVEITADMMQEVPDSPGFSLKLPTDKRSFTI